MIDGPDQGTINDRDANHLGTEKSFGRLVDKVCAMLAY